MTPMDELPRRGFTPLPPPLAGMDTAVRSGRRLRYRRRAGVGALAVAAFAGGLTLSGGVRLTGQDQLVPAGVPSRSATPTETVVAGAAPRPVLSAQPAASSTTTPSAALPQATVTPSPTRGSLSPYRTPELTRTYMPPPALSTPGSVRVCGGTFTGDTEGSTQSRTSWCLTTQAITTKRGHDLRLTLCRDQTGPGTMTFSHGHEVELVVRRGTREVWRWAAGRPDTGAAHTLQTPATACWEWTAPWTDVDQHGRRLPKGSYSVLAITQAKQIPTLPSDAVAFTV